MKRRVECCTSLKQARRYSCDTCRDYLAMRAEVRRYRKALRTVHRIVEQAYPGEACERVAAEINKALARKGGRK